jgi:hypothetical protein
VYSLEEAVSKKTVNVTLTAEQVAALQGALGDADTSKPLTDDQLLVTVELAISAWTDIFSGQKKYRSLTEQYLDWLTMIYSHILTDEEPSELRIFGRLNFSYGQGLYLARVLREQHAATWRKKSLMGLRDRLKSRLEDAKKWVKEERGSERMIFLLSKGSRTELATVLGTLAQQGNTGLSPIRTEGSMGGYSYVSIVAADVEPIFKQTQAALEG